MIEDGRRVEGGPMPHRSNRSRRRRHDGRGGHVLLLLASCDDIN